MNSPFYLIAAIVVVLGFAASIAVLWAIRSKRLACEYRVLAHFARASIADDAAFPLLIVLLDASDRSLAPYNEYAAAHNLGVVYLFAAPKWMADMKSRVWGAKLIAVDEEVARLFTPRKMFLLARNKFLL